MDLDCLLYPYLDPASQLSLALVRHECKETIVSLWETIQQKDRSRIANVVWLGYSGRKDVIPYVIESEHDFRHLLKGACRGQQIHLVSWILKQPHIYYVTIYLSELLYYGLKSHSKLIMELFLNQLPWQRVDKNELTMLHSACSDDSFAILWLDLIFRAYKSFSTTKQYDTFERNMGPTFNC
jgi:hypothetical protein